MNNLRNNNPNEISKTLISKLILPSFPKSSRRSRLVGDLGMSKRIVDILKIRVFISHSKITGV